MARILRSTLAVVGLLAACSDDGAAPIDAAVDSSIDGTPGPCGTEVMLTGEYIDWDSTQAAFAGLFNATWKVVMPAGGRMATTAPNGRVILCIAAGDTSQIDVTQVDYLPARVVADPAVFAPAGSSFVVRGLKDAMAAAQFNEFGVTIDRGAAQVLVYKIGAPTALALAPVVAPPQRAFVSDGDNDITWTAGATGTLTLFPNRPVGAGTATLTGTFTGPTVLPLAAGRFTVAVIR